MRRRWMLFVLVLSLALGTASAAVANPPADGERAVTVMTRNIYFGADLYPVITADTPEAFSLAVAQAYRQALDSDFEGRAEAIADEISEHEPMLVGIQEGATWSTGGFLDPAPAETVSVDFVGLIEKALADRGLDYSPVVVAHGVDVEAPGFDPSIPFAADVRLQVDDLVLARSGLTPADFEILDTSTGSYQTLATIPTSVGDITFDRQWAAVDARVYGSRFRFVTTHLEVLSQPLRTLQAGELLDAHQDSGLPTIYVGDFNDAAGEGGGADVMIGAGLTEAWPAAHPGELGPTAGQAADLRNELSTLTRRIDLVFTTQEWKVRTAEIVGDEIEDKTPSGLWPSDHAGVVVTVGLRPPSGTPAG